MSDIQDESSVPVCIFLSRMPQKEMRILQADLTDSWKSVSGEEPFVKDFHYIPWSKMLGHNETLRQIYKIVREISVRTGWSHCLLLDALSCLKSRAWLAQYDPDDAMGPVVKLGKVNELSRAACHLMSHEDRSEDEIEVYFNVQIRDPEGPFGSLGDEATLPTEPDLNRISAVSIGAGVSDPTLHLICIVHYSEQELTDMKAKLNRTLTSNYSRFNIIPWNGNGQATREMMYTIASKGLHGDQVCERDCRYLGILDEISKNTDSLILSRFKNLNFEDLTDPLLRRLDLARVPMTALPEILLGYEEYVGFDKPMFLDSLIEAGDSHETLHNPNLPLSIRQPIYFHQEDPGTLCFFLARFREEEEAHIKSELEYYVNPLLVDGFERKNITYVPWTGSEDVTPEDQEIWIPRFMSYLFINSKEVISHAIFVDRDALVVDSVILAQCFTGFSNQDWWDEGRDIGIRWGKVPKARAHFNCINLSLADVDWADIMEEGKYAKVFNNPDERRDLAERAKPYVEAGIWSDI